MRIMTETAPSSIESTRPKINLLSEIAHLPQKKEVALKVQNLIESKHGFNSQPINGSYDFPNLRNHHDGNKKGSVSTIDISQNPQFYMTLLYTIFNRHLRSTVEKNKRIGMHPGYENLSHLANAMIDHTKNIPIDDSIKDIALESVESDFVDAIFDANREYTILQKLTRDSMTGLWTRPALEQMFSALADLAESAESPLLGFTIIVLDIDNFKQINEDFGHDIGDHILQQFGGIIRSDDSGYRIGGEEFVYILPNFKSNDPLHNTAGLTSEQFLQTMTPRIQEIFSGMLEAFKQKSIDTPKGTIANRTFSGGADYITAKQLISLKQEGRLQLKSIFKQADNVLRLAKRIKNKSTLLLATPENLIKAERL